MSSTTALRNDALAAPAPRAPACAGDSAGAPRRDAVRAGGWLFAGQLLSMIGDQFTLIALPWLAYSESADATELGLILGLLGLPRALLLIVGGRIVDRFSARRVALASRAASAVLMGALAAVVWTHPEARGAIRALTAAIGAASAFTIVSSASLLPSVFERDRLAAANAISQAIRVGAAVVGPLAAAALIAATTGTPGTPHSFAHSAALSFAIDALSFVAGALLLLPVRVRAATVAVAEPGTAAGADATQAEPSSEHRVALRALFAYFLANAVIAAGSMQIIVPGLVASRLGGDGSLYGLVMAFNGLGALLGMGLAWRLRDGLRTRCGAAMLALDIASGAGFLAMTTLQHLVPTAALAVALGACGGVVQVNTFTWIQTHTPPQRIGRTMAAFLFIFLGLVPVSAPLFGALQARLSLDALLWIVGGAQIAISVVAAAIGPLRRMRY